MDESFEEFIAAGGHFKSKWVRFESDEADIWNDKINIITVEFVIIGNREKKTQTIVL